MLLPAATWRREGGHGDQFRTPHQPRRRRRAAPGEARADWEIAADFARRLGAAWAKAIWPTGFFTYEKSEQIFNEHRATTRGRDLDITGLSYAMLDVPRPAAMALSGRRTGRHGALVRRWRVPHRQRQRARFSDTRYRPAAEQTDARYPFAPDHRPPARPVARHEPHRDWRRACSATSRSRCWRCMPPIMARRGLKDGGLVRIKSRRGELVLPVEASRETADRGRCFCPCTGAAVHERAGRECADEQCAAIPNRTSRS